MGERGGVFVCLVVWFAARLNLSHCDTGGKAAHLPRKCMKNQVVSMETQLGRHHGGLKQTHAEDCQCVGEEQIRKA